MCTTKPYSEDFQSILSSFVNEVEHKIFIEQDLFIHNLGLIHRNKGAFYRSLERYIFSHPGDRELISNLLKSDFIRSEEYINSYPSPSPCLPDLAYDAFINSLYEEYKEVGVDEDGKSRKKIIWSLKSYIFELYTSRISNWNYIATLKKKKKKLSNYD